MAKQRRLAFLAKDCAVRGFAHRSMATPVDPIWTTGIQPDFILLERKF